MDTRPTTVHAVVSDLHLGDGGALEDFVFEHDFCSFLDFLDRRGRAAGGRAELVFNGDSLDFLQTGPLGYGPWRGAIGKIQRIARSHRQAFESLGRFVGAGNRLVVLPGNHDIELVFGEVQAALRAAVAGGDPAAAKNVVFPNDSPLGAHFRGRERGPFAYRLPGVYIEHGNQFDSLNFFDHREFYVSGDEQRIVLPWGSHFVLDLFNEVESNYRFIDKLRPRNAALLILWLIDPKLVRERLPALAALGRQLYPELRRYQRESRAIEPGARGGGAPALDQEGRFLAWLGTFADDMQAVDAHHAELSAGAGSRGILSDRLSAAYASIFRAALDALTSRPAAATDDDGYATRALELGRAEAADVVVLGHTHGARDIPGDGIRYLNCGTWIGLLDLDREQLRDASTEQYRKLLDRLREERAFMPLRLLSFVEIAYPGGRLDASLRTFSSGNTEGIAR